MPPFVLPRHDVDLQLEVAERVIHERAVVVGVAAPTAFATMAPFSILKHAGSELPPGQVFAVEELRESWFGGGRLHDDSEHQRSEADQGSHSAGV